MPIPLEHMTEQSTYYDLLGIERSASLAEIRCAYVRLMKKHHPDKSLSSEARDASGFVALINRSYETLSDPVKRAAYDDDLRRRGRVNSGSWPSPVLAVPTDTFTRGRLGILLLVALACAALAPAIASLESLSRFAPPISFWPKSPAAEPAGLSRLGRTDLIRQHVKLATSLSPVQALAFSDRCFRRAEADQSGRMVQLCIIFDDAFLYWRQTPEWDALLPPYFNEQVVHARHTGSLLRFRTNVDGTLAHLRYQAFHALLEYVGQPDVPATNPT